MVFKARFFSSSRKADPSSPDGPSNSPRAPSSHANPRRGQTSSSPSSSTSSPSTSSSRSDKRKPKPELSSAASNKSKTKETPSPAAPGDAEKPAPGVPSTLSPILASSLGLNRIKTRSGPLPQEGLRGEHHHHRIPGLGSSNLSKVQHRSDVNSTCSTSSSSSAAFVSPMPSKGDGSRSELGKMSRSKELEHSKSRLVSGFGGLESNSAVKTGKLATSWNSNEIFKTPDTSQVTECQRDSFETPSESESPRFREIMQATSAPRKRMPADIKSFSHELNSKGVRPFPFWKPRSIYNLKEVLKDIQVKFEKAKEEVNSDLAIFAGDLISIMEKHADSHPEWKETLEDLLILARSCCVMTPSEFWLQCEGIVQDLDDQRQGLPMGVLKKLYTRILFILTRCTRLLQFHKESRFPDEEAVTGFCEPINALSADKQNLGIPKADDNHAKSRRKSTEIASTRKSYSQEQHHVRDKRSQEIKAVNHVSSLEVDAKKEIVSPSSRERLSSWKPLPSPHGKIQKEITASKHQISDRKHDAFSPVNMSPEFPSSNPLLQTLHQRNVSCGNWSDQPNISEEGSIMCRICEEYVPISYVEEHSKICAVADHCDQKGINVDERLIWLAEILEKIVEIYSQKDVLIAVGSPEVAKVSNSSPQEESDGASPKFSDLSRGGSADNFDCFQESENPVCLDDVRNFTSSKIRYGPKSDQGMTASSAGSMTPRSPLATPRSNLIEMLLAGRYSVIEGDDTAQMIELADISRCIANAPLYEERSLSYLVSCVECLQEVINKRKHEALTVQTFGTRIEKLHREKYLQLCDVIDTEKIDSTCNLMDEEDDVVRSLRASPVHPAVKDRTSIDDFEIIKPISRGAFGRVFLAKKRTTGDLFAIKVLRKADMIRKNAVESILAERNILIAVRNPFVVRFFYSFTSRDNLYLVMEYLNGGDLYSLLRNMGCLDEEVARVYIAEVVLALEYLHSERIVHRDLKPDNLLIAHDGHIKLTDFGLSKVGLINSTDDLSGPAISGMSLYGEDEAQIMEEEKTGQTEQLKKRSAVGTPDYLAPEILLGTGHGAAADWWSVGVILFELIVGIPPFNAEHPQTIFDNILNRKIPWPQVPEEMSFDARDLIDRLLTEDPNQRLGAEGASEVKQHSFFKNINWDTLARQKAAFVPSSESAFDTSYFSSRYSWNPSDEHIHEAYEYEDSSENGSISGSSCVSNRQDDMDEQCGSIATLESESTVNYSFSNFSFKNLSQLATINYDLLNKGLKDDPAT